MWCKTERLIPGDKTIGLLARIPVLIFLIIFVILSTAYIAIAGVSHSGDQLSFEDRMVCQEIIDGVYWEHRLWPKENTRPKPSFHEVMSEGYIARKVEDSLKVSVLLEQYWQRPIRPEQLQAEIERIARSSRRPEILRRIWAELGNDTFRIAECHARPLLVDRLARSWFSYDHRIHGPRKEAILASLRTGLSLDALVTNAEQFEDHDWVCLPTDAETSSGETRQLSSDTLMMEETLDAEEWKDLLERLASAFNLPVDARPPSIIERLPLDVISGLSEGPTTFTCYVIREKSDTRLRVGVVTWSKTSFESWWSGIRNTLPETINVPVYQYSLPIITPAGESGCQDDTWTRIGYPSNSRHSAVWTGSEMLVWEDGLTSCRYDPATNTWTDISGLDAPLISINTAVVWTGTEMIVWGGSNKNIGGRYNPITNTWLPMSLDNAPAGRQRHRMVWTGSHVLVWGGDNQEKYMNDGGRYDPVTDSWQAISASAAPEGRSYHTLVWTGSRMIVWGGVGLGTTRFNDGGLYDPLGDSWQPINVSDAPAARERHSGVWTGQELVIWGGRGNQVTYNDGKKYHPTTDMWTVLTSTGAPYACEDHATVWTGSEMIVWRKYGNIQLHSCYHVATDTWREMSTLNEPSGRDYFSAIWADTEMIVWGGLGTNMAMWTGGRYSPATDSWIPIGDTNAPAPRPNAYTVWTGTEMLLWGGCHTGSSVTPFPTGGLYDMITDSWRPISNENRPCAYNGTSYVWTGLELIVWGGMIYDKSAKEELYINSGGRYNLSTDTWAHTSMDNAPTPRAGHAAVWTGSEILVWGGYCNYDYYRDGKRYDPVSDTWTPISTDNAPDPGTELAEVWTGTEMVLFRPVSYGVQNPSGRYNPVTDTWRSVSMVGSPDIPQYYGFASVWSGQEMLVWAGGYVNVGGRYNPSADIWLPITSVDCPIVDESNLGIWTGTEMIVWGWPDNEGGRYNPWTDQWRPTSIENVPKLRRNHSAAWTGSEMIVWGGLTYSSVYVNSGGIYCAAPSPTVPALSFHLMILLIGLFSLVIFLARRG